MSSSQTLVARLELLVLTPGSRVYAWNDFGPLHGLKASNLSYTPPSTQRGGDQSARQHTPQCRVIDDRLDHNLLNWKPNTTRLCGRSRKRRRNGVKVAVENREVRWL